MKKEKAVPVRVRTGTAFLQQAFQTVRRKGRLRQTHGRSGVNASVGFCQQEDGGDDAGKTDEVRQREGGAQPQGGKDRGGQGFRGRQHGGLYRPHVLDALHEEGKGHDGAQHHDAGGGQPAPEGEMDRHGPAAGGQIDGDAADEHA